MKRTKKAKSKEPTNEEAMRTYFREFIFAVIEFARSQRGIPLDGPYAVEEVENAVASLAGVLIPFAPFENRWRLLSLMCQIRRQELREKRCRRR